VFARIFAPLELTPLRGREIVLFFKDNSGARGS
jgi:hypothetical protein